MASFTVIVNDDGVTAIKTCVSPKSAADWLQEQVDSLAAQCIGICRTKKEADNAAALKGSGVTGLGDLTAAEIDAIKTGRAK